jgi:aminoglycoside phosphotransferase (APT) family kinase protein
VALSLETRAVETRAAVGTLIAQEYGIAAAAIVEGPRGTVGETFILTATSGRRYFAKLFYPRENWRAPDRSLAVLRDLRAAGIDALTYPLPSTRGALSVYLGERRLLLYEFIAGSSGTSGFDFPSFVDLLARIHQADVPACRTLPRETFDPEVLAAWVAGMARVWSSPGETAPQIALRRFLAGYRDDILRYGQELLALAEACQERTAPLMITHSDALEHNLLVNEAGKIYITDWDEMLLGPPERDTWFWLYDERSTPFLRGYRRLFPAYAPDPTFCRFYLLRRFHEDFVGVFEEIDRGNVADQQRLLDHVIASWHVWLWDPLQMPGPRAE